MSWVCTKCGEPGAEPESKLLDGNYGSGRCHSIWCKHKQRLFHLEKSMPDPEPKTVTVSSPTIGMGAEIVVDEPEEDPVSDAKPSEWSLTDAPLSATTFEPAPPLPEAPADWHTLDEAK